MLQAPSLFLPSVSYLPFRLSFSLTDFVIYPCCRLCLSCSLMWGTVSIPCVSLPTFCVLFRTAGTKRAIVTVPSIVIVPDSHSWLSSSSWLLHNAPLLVVAPSIFAVLF